MCRLYILNSCIIIGHASIGQDTDCNTKLCHIVTLDRSHILIRDWPVEFFPKTKKK
jgi:hypothetical protein